MVHAAGLISTAWAARLAVCVALGCMASAQAAEPVEISASHEGRRVALRVTTTLAAPHAVIWATLTDYDNTARWIPGMSWSRVLERRADGAVVEQAGHADVLFFSLAVNVVVDVQEQPPSRIGIKLVRGDFRHLEGAYRLSPVPARPGQQQLEWAGTMELRSALPGFVAQKVLKENIRLQFQGLVDEIERRAQAGGTSR